MTSTDRSRLRSRSVLILGLFLAVSGLGCAWILAQESSNTDLASMLASSLPLGVENKELLLPQFDAQGRRSSLLTADVVRRVDDERLYAEVFSWQQFADTEARSLRIEMPTAYFNLKTSTLRGTSGGKVSRSDFQIEGERMIYDTRTGQGMMEGNIRMVIFDTTAKRDDKPTAPKP
ncbi:MAG: hypothetical protein IPK32_17355 [Verrucomicrobiaceae bacterium]|nr:hypothetical protein [Verrucomicrobiaceae bacterium]